MFQEFSSFSVLKYNWRTRTCDSFPTMGMPRQPSTPRRGGLLNLALIVTDASGMIVPLWSHYLEDVHVSVTWSELTSKEPPLPTAVIRWSEQNGDSSRWKKRKLELWQWSGVMGHRVLAATRETCSWYSLHSTIFRHGCLSIHSSRDNGAKSSPNPGRHPVYILQCNCCKISIGHMIQRLDLPWIPTFERFI